jgi:hypothetical protein
MPSPLAKKLLIKPGQQVAVINAPTDYLNELGALPEGVTLTATPNGKFDQAHLFAKDTKELKRLAPRALRALKPDGILWISYPKGSSKIQTDLTRDVGWDVVRDAGFEGVSLISVNDVWSAMRFRPSTQVGKKKK